MEYSDYDLIRGIKSGDGDALELLVRRWYPRIFGYVQKTLVLENVSKLYGDTVALDRTSFTLNCGIYGLLGPNGAGKTTLMRIMTDLLAPSTGRVLLDGQDISALGGEFRKRLGYLPQDFGVYPNFTAEQFLLYIGRLKGLSKFEAKRQTDELLHLMGLEEKHKKKLESFSGGSGKGWGSPRRCWAALIF